MHLSQILYTAPPMRAADSKIIVCVPCVYRRGAFAKAASSPADRFSVASGRVGQCGTEGQPPAASRNAARGAIFGGG